MLLPGFISPLPLNTDLRFPSCNIYHNPKRYLLFSSAGEASGSKKPNTKCTSVQARLKKECTPSVSLSPWDCSLRFKTVLLGPQNQHFRVYISQMSSQSSKESMWIFQDHTACFWQRLVRDLSCPAFLVHCVLLP